MQYEQDKTKPSYKNRLVTSVGNAWIICHSKSYPGRIYYFNTSNGKTAWNLSESEIEKAKQTTEILQSQPGADLRKCPEPKDHPPMDLENTFTPSRIYNKQIINNQFPSNATCSSSFGSIHSLNPLNIPAFNSYNSYVWAQAPGPPSTPILLLPIVNQAEAIRTLPENNYQQGFSEPNFSGTFTNSLKSGNNAHYANTFRRHTNRGRPFHTWRNIRGRRVRGNIVKNNFHCNKKDLRQILLSKRNCSSAIVNEDVLRPTKEVTDNNFEKDCNEPEELNWKEDVPELKHESSSRLDLKPLRDLANLNTKHECWYIVADTEVLLNNFSFLNTLIDSDAQCHLMIPRQVISELQSCASVSENVLARRVVRFLCHEIETGSAFIDEDSMQSEQNESSIVYNTCLKLAKDNYHVILVSNNKQMRNFKNNSHKIKVFSIQEVKNLVTNDPYKQLQPTMRSSAAFDSIKIVIPNDMNKIITTKETIVENLNAGAASTSSKLCTNTEVQTEITDPNVFPNCPNAGMLEEINCKETTCPETAKIDNPTKSGHDFYSNENNSKNRKLILQRSISNKTVVDQSPEKKSFKWRRRRNLSTNNCSDEQKLLTNDSNIGAPSQVNIDTKKIRRDTDNNEKKPLQNNSELLYKNYVESSESSGSNDKNIIIEETSSEVISNTVSNVDSESLFSPNGVTCKLDPTKVMYEVTNESMEAYLKMRCDEWVSRFVQIMEEVLREILQQDPPFENTDLPPPWTLHEATRCIIKKFCNHYHVVDAANNLSLVLFMNSDKKGNIDKNMEPSKYMKMYSYGVYLVDTLQNVTTNCEDLQTAADSLKKLLYDIENPNMDASNNDTFADDPADASADKQDTRNSGQSCYTATQDDIDDDHCGSNEQTESSNPSKTRKLFQNQSHQKLDLNIENAFFNSLELRKNDNLMIDEDNKDGIVDNRDLQDSPNKDDDEKQINSIGDKEENHNGTLNEPTFVRNFTKYAEFEERLKNSSKRYYDLDDDFSSNYAEDFEYSTEEYMSDDYIGNQENIAEDLIVFEETDKIDTSKSENETQHIVNSVVGTKQIKQCMGLFLLEINETFSNTHSMCEKYFEEFKKPQPASQVVRQVIQEKFEKAYFHIDNIYKLLDSILVREMTDPDNNIQHLLRKANIVNFVFEEELSIEYRKLVMKCKKHAFSLLTAIEYMSTVAKI